MLTNQHRFVAGMINCAERTHYKKHMCGVCHALGDDYGMVSRLITNHEIILLNMLTEAQCKTLEDDVMRRCPLNPSQHVRTNQTVSSRFAAAIAIMLVNTSVEDDLRDGKGLQLPTRLLKTMTSRLAAQARDTLTALSFDTSRLLSLQDEQSYAEDHHQNPLLPSMQSSATIFAMTASLAGQTQNQSALADIGSHYGAYLYLLDALKDYAEDYRQGQYNPLMPYVQISDTALVLNQEGVNWVKNEMTLILDEIQSGLDSIQLHHYQSAVHKMLVEPIQRLLTRLTTVKDGIAYTRIGSRDILKSFLLMSDNKKTGQDVDEFFSDDDKADHPTKQKGKKRRNRKQGDGGGCCDGEDAADVGFYACIYSPWDMISCVDLDCDGIPNCIDTDAGCIGVDGCGGGDGCDIGGCDGMDCDCG